MLKWAPAGVGGMGVADDAENALVGGYVRGLQGCLAHKKLQPPGTLGGCKYIYIYIYIFIFIYIYILYIYMYVYMVIYIYIYM